MSPQVINAEGMPYDGSACDVWSMGVMLYVMVVCNYPFGFDGPGGIPIRKLLAKIGAGRFSFPSIVRAPSPPPHTHTTTTQFFK